MTSNDNPAPTLDRILVLAGGLCGVFGVALSAAAAHRGGTFTATAASFLLMHAPLFVAVGLLGGNRLLRGGSFALLAGLVVFSGDLLARDFLGFRLFPFAAPTGGTLLMAGWLCIALSALARPRRNS